MKRKILSEDQIRFLFQQYCGGIMLKDLAKKNGINRKSLSAAFARRGPRKADIPGAITRSELRKHAEGHPNPECPSDCRFMMTLNAKPGQKTTHCGYILFKGNGARGCDPGPKCKRYEPKKRK